MMLPLTPTPCLVLLLLLTSPDLTYLKIGVSHGSGALNARLSAQRRISLFGNGFDPWKTVGVRKRGSSYNYSRLSTGPGSNLASSDRRGCPGFQKTSRGRRSQERGPLKAPLNALLMPTENPCRFSVLEGK
jgi:hypothetical protein